jgi:hypothetical protein
MSGAGIASLQPAAVAADTGAISLTIHDSLAESEPVWRAF